MAQALGLCAICVSGGEKQVPRAIGPRCGMTRQKCGRAAEWQG